MRPADLGDCERTRSTGLAQPVNALSSLGFIPAAAWVWRTGRRGGDPRIGRWLALVMLANGIGSFWYHGPYHEAGARLHDAAAIAYAGLVAVADSGGPRRFPEAVAVVAGFATMAAAIDRRTTGVGAATIGAILAGVEAARAGGDDHPGRGGLAMTAAAAAGAYVLGRSDSRLCRPESPLQLHALWHLLAAAAGMAWMRARLPSTG